MAKILFMKTALIAFVGSLSFAALAYADTQKIDVPAGELIAALESLAKQADVDLVYQDAQVKGLRTAGVSGNLSPQDALAKLLEGTSLRIRKDEASGAILITPPLASSGPTSSDAGSETSSSELSTAQKDDVNSLRLAQSKTQDKQDIKKPDSSSKEETGEIVVTGSHIRGTSPTSPVIVLDRAYIERSGKSTVADVIRTLPQNFNGGGNVGMIGAGGVNTNGTDASRINLRGLGTGATLVLVNGHRLAFNSTSGGPDISGIPLSAVERIDVLTDGASAIYGSDAIAGVVNIKLLPSFEGAETTAYLGDTTDGGGFQQRYAQLLGTNWTGGSALLNMEFAKDGKIDRSQRDFTQDLSNDEYSLQPNLERRSVFASVSQALLSRMTVHLDAMYADRESDSIQSQPSAFYISNAIEAEQHLIAAGLKMGLSKTWDLALTFQDGEDETLTGGQVRSPPTAPVSDLQSQRVTNGVRSGEAILSGNVFDLPAGPLQVAGGGGYREFSIDRNGTQFKRASTFSFSEARVPLIGGRSTSSSLPVVEGVLAARYEKFDDFGSTFDPKFGLAWRATDEATLRASWGTSFRAPELIQQHVPPSRSLRRLNPPQGGKSTYLLVATGNADLTAETSSAWNFSVLYEPHWARNLQLNVSAFQIEYEDRIATPFDPFTVAIANQLTYAQYFTFNPTQAQQDTAIALGTLPVTNLSGLPYDPNNVAFILDSRLKNLSRVRARGVDLQLDYNVGVSKGDLAAFLNTSWIEQKQKASPFVPTVETTGTVFNPPHYRARGGATWTIGEIAATGVLNFTGSYDNNLSAVQNRVDSWLTLDAQLSYRPTWTGLWSGLHLNLSVQNLFNRDPPDVVPGTFISTGDVGFDTTNASAVGRMIGIAVRKSW